MVYCCCDVPIRSLRRDTHEKEQDRLHLQRACDAVLCARFPRRAGFGHADRRSQQPTRVFRIPFELSEPDDVRAPALPCARAHVVYALCLQHRLHPRARPYRRRALREPAAFADVRHHRDRLRPVPHVLRRQRDAHGGQRHRLHAHLPGLHGGCTSGRNPADAGRRRRAVPDTGNLQGAVLRRQHLAAGAHRRRRLRRGDGAAAAQVSPVRIAQAHEKGELWLSLLLCKRFTITDSP